jgi:hypothetical protein
MDFWNIWIHRIPYVYDMGKLGFAPGYTTSVWIPEAEDL